LQTLINDNGVPQEPNDGVTSDNNNLEIESAFLTKNPRSTVRPSLVPRMNEQEHSWESGGNYNGRNGNGNGSTNLLGNGGWDEQSSLPEGGFYENGNGTSDQRHGKAQQFAKNAQRTLTIANLVWGFLVCHISVKPQFGDMHANFEIAQAEGVTHADIVDVVRGGMLLDIYLRTNERACNISFLEERDAKKFFQYVKRNDLYIKNKRVEIKWSDRQFILPGHVSKPLIHTTYVTQKQILSITELMYFWDNRLTLSWLLVYWLPRIAGCEQSQHWSYS
jgi:hypothetical protein